MAYYITNIQRQPHGYIKFLISLGIYSINLDWCTRIWFDTSLELIIPEEFGGWDLITTYGANLQRETDHYVHQEQQKHIFIRCLHQIIYIDLASYLLYLKPFIYTIWMEGMSHGSATNFSPSSYSIWHTTHLYSFKLDVQLNLIA